MTETEIVHLKDIEIIARRLVKNDADGGGVSQTARDLEAFKAAFAAVDKARNSPPLPAELEEEPEESKGAAKHSKPAVHTRR